MPGSFITRDGNTNRWKQAGDQNKTKQSKAQAPREIPYRRTAMPCRLTRAAAIRYSSSESEEHESSSNGVDAPLPKLYPFPIPLAHLAPPQSILTRSPRRVMPNRLQLQFDEPLLESLSSDRDDGDVLLVPDENVAEPGELEIELE